MLGQVLILFQLFIEFFRDPGLDLNIAELDMTGVAGELQIAVSAGERTSYESVRGKR
jgi:hypothetical protein